MFQLAALSRLEGDDERAEARVEEALALFRRIEDPRGIEHCLAFRAGSSRRILATILFVDIVGSTQRAAELGDRRWRELLAAFQQLVRQKLPDFGGREVDTAGDGFLTVFDAPAQGIGCAQSIAAGARRLGIELRGGIHTGECERVGEALRGIAVHIGARVAALAEPGELLVTGTVKDLIFGSSVELEARGTHPLKGVPGEWPLFAVRSAAPGE
jgi:class 3 adenylate cyclase